MAESVRFKHLESRLMKKVGSAIADYQMIGAGDVVLVCLSGGKDSYTMLSVLLELQRRAPVDFRIIAMNLDQKQPGFPADVLPRYLEELGVAYRIVEADTYSIVKDKIPAGKTTCSLCSRLRRGIIYRTASELGATRIALGHHREDLIETLFLNMFFGGVMKSMAPRLATDDGRHVVIRPLAYCAERDIAAYARAKKFPIIPCDLCGSQENLQRQRIKEMLTEWEQMAPGRLHNIFRAMQHVVPSHLADTELFEFAGSAPAAAAEDALFDHEVPRGLAFELAEATPQRLSFARSIARTAAPAAPLAALE